MSEVEKGSNKTPKRKVDEYFEEWCNGTRVVACFIDQDTGDKWHYFYTSAEVSCLQKGVILYEKKQNTYYKITVRIFNIDVGELYIYVKPYSIKEVEVLGENCNLKSGPEYPETKSAPINKDKLSKELSLSYYL